MSNSPVVPVASFYVAGEPRPAGSKTPFPIRNKAGIQVGTRLVDASGKKGKAWRGDCRDAALAAYGEFRPLLKGPLSVSFTFYRVRPKGHYGTGKNADKLKPWVPAYPAVVPDVLKLARAVEDALTGVIWEDDEQIVTELLCKRYAEKPGVQVHIYAEPLAAAQLPEAKQLALL